MYWVLQYIAPELIQLMCIVFFFSSRECYIGEEQRLMLLFLFYFLFISLQYDIVHCRDRLEQGVFSTFCRLLKSILRQHSTIRISCNKVGLNNSMVLNRPTSPKDGMNKKKKTLLLFTNSFFNYWYLQNRIRRMSVYI